MEAAKRLLGTIYRASEKPVSLTIKCALALVISGVVAAGPVMAEKPSWAGSGKDGKDQRDEQRGERRDDGQQSRHDRDDSSAAQRRHFEDQHRVVVRQYYEEQYRGSRCPPGLAKKQNGCIPPGQARKWQIGKPLPRNVIYYSVPQPLVVQIGLPPAGHRYVRVAGDILLIAIGTGMVIDAIQDLGR